MHGKLIRGLPVSKLSSNDFHLSSPGLPPGHQASISIPTVKPLGLDHPRVSDREYPETRILVPELAAEAP